MRENGIEHYCFKLSVVSSNYLGETCSSTKSQTILTLQDVEPEFRSHCGHKVSLHTDMVPQPTGNVVDLLVNPP